MKALPLKPPPGGRPLMTAHGAGGFRFGPLRIEGSFLIVGEQPVPWPVREIDEALPGTLAPLFEPAERPGFLLLGTGARLAQAPPALRAALAEAGIGLEIMASGPAARVYNTLAGEGRAFAAALIAVPAATPAG